MDTAVVMTEPELDPSMFVLGFVGPDGEELASGPCTYINYSVPGKISMRGSPLFMSPGSSVRGVFLKDCAGRLIRQLDCSCGTYYAGHWTPGMVIDYTPVYADPEAILAEYVSHHCLAVRPYSPSNFPPSFPVAFRSLVMPAGAWFWIIMVILILGGFFWYAPANVPRPSPWIPAVVLVLFFLIGWYLFGPPLR